jgi:rhodanese-related sulfurtransferase
MKWKQFFTPVTSINGARAREIVAAGGNDVLYLDVRQPKEYQRGHLPGAKLIPIGELDQRLGELNKEQPTIIY